MSNISNNTLIVQGSFCGVFAFCKDLHQQDNLSDVMSYGYSSGRETFTFTTQWTPPMNWIEQMSKQHPDLTFGIFGYDTIGDYSAIMVSKDGQEVLLEEGDVWSKCEEDSWDVIDAIEDELKETLDRCMSLTN